MEGNYGRHRIFTQTIDGEERRQSFKRRVQEARGEVRVVQLDAPAPASAKPAAKSVDKGLKPAL